MYNLGSKIMGYKALYRTYRPSLFSEVAGQEAIVKTLQNALLSNKLSHAYLFSGPRGTGKTTMAKLFAKALNCEEGVGQQCNQCENCTLLNQNAHPDIIEIDAASNNGVDEVRELIDKVKYSPIKGRYKVYIIDEVHMMTPSAFNALLKTLEEPPSHVIFVLATTEPHKIIPTILSRCQRYDFGKVSLKDMHERMTRVLKEENVSIEPDALTLILQLADGGMRDALSMLDQAIAFNQDTITSADLFNLFGMVSVDEKLTLLEAIGQGNVTRFVQQIDRLTQLGVDEKRFLNDIVDLLKDVLILFKTKNPDLLYRLNESTVNRLLDALTLDHIERLLKTIFYLLSDFKANGQWLRLFEVETLATMSANPILATKTSPNIMQPLPAKSPIHIPATNPISTQLTDTGDVIYIDDLNIIKIMVEGNKEAKQELLREWHQLETYAMDPALSSFALLLQDGKPYVLSEHVLILEYDNPLMAKKCNILANQSAIQDLLANMYPEPILIYGVNRQESLKLNKLFLDLRQLGKLPAKNNIPPTVKNWKFPS
jgi:DNA polymerase III subunit gamma/tau